MSNHMTNDAQKEVALTFAPAIAKTVETVMFLIEEAAKLQIDLTWQHIVNVLWLADKDHLDNYGRPVTFDNYEATHNGPVGLTASAILDPGYDWKPLDMVSAPWSCEKREESATSIYRQATRPCNVRKLSGSDGLALRRALEFVNTQDASLLQEHMLDDPAFRAAKSDNADGSYPIDPRMISAVRDDDLIADLVYASRHRV